SSAILYACRTICSLSAMSFSLVATCCVTAVAELAGQPSLLQQAVGQDNLDDRRDCFRAGPVALQLACERDPADRLRAGLDHALKTGPVSLGRGAGDRVNDR